MGEGARTAGILRNRGVREGRGRAAAEKRIRVDQKRLPNRDQPEPSLRGRTPLRRGEPEFGAGGLPSRNGAGRSVKTTDSGRSKELSWTGSKGCEIFLTPRARGR